MGSTERLVRYNSTLVVMETSAAVGALNNERPLVSRRGTN